MEELENKFFGLREGLISVDQFAEWFYENEWLREVMGNEAYENLLLVNFKSPHNFTEIKKILTPLIDEGKLEKKRLQVLLSSIINKDEKAAESLIAVYHAYGEGYFFLKELALNMATRLINPGPHYETNNFSDLTSKERENLLNSLYPEAMQIAVKINTWLERSEIILTGEQEKELGRWQFIDQRISKGS